MLGSGQVTAVVVVLFDTHEVCADPDQLGTFAMLLSLA